MAHRASRLWGYVADGARGMAVPMLLLIAASCGPPPRPTYYVADRGADSDGDGIADIDDACPTEAEDGLAPKANDGCPADDPDMDGIGRATDKCPWAKEDGQPPDAYDGCPAKDSDGDGVGDFMDKCPGQMEDGLPPLPNDGCAGDDGDNDGIRGAADLCPTQPETYNGYQDEDGCPDNVPGTVVVYDDKSSTIFIPASLKIEFEFGSFKLSAQASAAIGAIAQVLKATPAISRLEIEGHASTKGDSAANLAITQQRANAVAQALMAQGVPAAKLFPMGYGEYCNAIDRGDEVDEPVNRRVVFKTVVVNNVWQPVPRGCWRAVKAGINPTTAKSLATATPGPVVEKHGGGI